MSHTTPNTDLDDITVEQVQDDGTVVLRMPSGYEVQLAVPAAMVPYYRRLVPAREGVVPV